MEVDGVSGILLDVHGRYTIFAGGNQRKMVVLWGFMVVLWDLPSGKRLTNWKDLPFSMGESTISTGPFSRAMWLY